MHALRYDSVHVAAVTSPFTTPEAVRSIHRERVYAGRVTCVASFNTSLGVASPLGLLNTSCPTKGKDICQLVACTYWGRTCDESRLHPTKDHQNLDTGSTIPLANYRMLRCFTFAWRTLCERGRSMTVQPCTRLAGHGTWTLVASFMPTHEGRVASQNPLLKGFHVGDARVKKLTPVSKRSIGRHVEF